jgi:hypothetical protein
MRALHDKTQPQEGVFWQALTYAQGIPYYCASEVKHAWRYAFTYAASARDGHVVADPGVQFLVWAMGT